MSSGAWGPATMQGLNTYASVPVPRRVSASTCSTSAFWAE